MVEKLEQIQELVAKWWKVTQSWWVQALFKRNDTDPGCQKELESILSMIIIDKGTKGKTGKPPQLVQHALSLPAVKRSGLEEDM